MKKRQIGIGTVNISDNAQNDVLRILKSNRLSSGKFTEKFESQLASLHGRRFAIFCNSGTSALHVSLSVLKEKYKWRDGDEVIVPAVTFVATSNVIIHNNLKPVFVDIEDDYYSINPELIEAKITPKTRAIMSVHLFGQSADMEPIMKIANAYKLKVIEDSAEAMFVKYKNKPVGFHGDIACFSTYATHLITTGVGGLAMTNDSQLAIMIKSFFNHGRDSIYLTIDDDDKISSQKLFKIVPRRFSFRYIGHSFRLTEIEAVLGLDQLERWQKIIKTRQTNAGYLTYSLTKFSNFLKFPKIRPNSEHAFMLYPILILDNRFEREKLINFLEINGIETRYLMPLINQPIYQKIFGDIEKNYPVAKYVNKNGFLIGCHQDLSKEDLGYIISIFERFFKKFMNK